MRQKIFIVTLALLAVIVAAVAPALPMATPRVAAQTAVTNTLTLSVISARTEPNAPGGPVVLGDPVTTFKYIINVDNTGNPDQPREAGCSPSNAGYPDSCDWPSIRAVPGAAPIFTQGTQADFAAGAGINLPNGKYLISVLADGYKIGGQHFTVPLEAPGRVTVELQPHPLPAATMRIKAFEDVSPTNGMFDAPAENGLPGAKALINDILGQVSVDVFGNPLCTQYDANGDPLPTPSGQPADWCLYSDANGDIVVPNLGPNRYDVNVVPPSPNFIQTTTLEGSHSWDTWLQEGGTGLDNEFVVAGEPFPWTVFGYAPRRDNLNSSANTGGIRGTIVGASVYVPWTGGLPYYGGQWGGLNGSKVTGPIKEAWVALSDLQNGDTAVYVAPADPVTGYFQIDNVPDGNYFFTYWDYAQEYILDWMQVAVVNGQMTDIGTPFLTGWFTWAEGYVFNDLNSNGQKDPGEPGIADYLVVLKDRDNTEIDRMTIAVTTDSTGYYRFDRAYPMGSWMILEAYNDRYYTTGVTYQVENQPEPTTVMGAGVDVGILPMLGQTGRLDWGVRPYAPGTNGGIVGTVFYDTTRNELDARYQAVEGWAPGIPNLRVNVYKPVPCGTTAGAACDPSDMYELAADGSIAKDMTAGGVACGTTPGATCDPSGTWELDELGNYSVGPVINTALTEQWEQPIGCQPRDANGNPYTNTAFLSADYMNQRCLEGPQIGLQFQSGFASLDGNYGFGTVFSGFGSTAEPVESASMPAGDYLVEAVTPLDSLGRPMYQVVREEDINVFNGDEFVPQIPPPACAGSSHTVDVEGILPDGPNAVSNPSFADTGGSPFEGMEKPLCSVKLVTVSNGRSVAPTFTLFTDVPIPGKWKGYIIDDLTLSTDPASLNFGEKGGVPNSPIGIYDFTNRLVLTINSDPNGVYEVLLPSTYSINCPTPSGVCPNVYYILGNDPGQPDRPNANYNPQYRTIGTSFEVWPGVMLPSDLAPTQIVSGILAPGSTTTTPASCLVNDPLAPTTPELFAISRPYYRTNEPSSTTFTITGQGFGSATGRVLLDNTAQMNVTTWNPTQITFTVPNGTATGARQLKIVAANGKSTVNGLTFHVIGGGYNPDVYEVGPGRTYNPANYPAYPGAIQAAINAAAARPNRNSLVVVYPGMPAQWNPQGSYLENVVMYAPVKLQGVGPGGGSVLGSVIDGRGVAGDTAYAASWVNFVLGIPWDGNQAISEGAVVYVLASNNEFQSGFPAAIDGFTIQGGDQQGFPNLVNPIDPTIKDVGAIQGGGIFANAYARYLQITNNVIESNGGAYAGAIRLGTPHLPGALNDNQNDSVRIANNRILANGGTNLAGAIGVFSGSQGYEIASNDICGNFSAEYGGGISHYGLSPNGSIHDNRIYFNRSYDEAGGIMIAGELPADPAVLTPGAGPVNIYNNLIQANLANDDGGGLRFLMSGNFVYNVYNNIVVNNVSTHEGGGVSLNDAPQVRFFNNTVMKNITTATAMTSDGNPAPAGLSSSRNSALLQATLPGGSPLFSNPLLFNNLFWDNRAGSFVPGSGVLGIGLNDVNGNPDPTPINYWDMGVAGNFGYLLSPTNSLMQTASGTNPALPATPNIIGTPPSVESEYSTSIAVLPWRGNPRFVDTLLVATELPISLMGNYHIQSGSPAFNAGAASKNGVNAPAFDIDNQSRPALGGFDIGADEYSGLQADLSITKSNGVTSVSAGGSLTYVITVNNAGPSAATGATVTDNMPAALTGVTWTCSATIGSSCNVANGNGNINTTVSLANNGSATFTVNATVAANATGTVANTATVAPPSGTTDPTLSNNSATDTDTIVVPLPSLALLDNFNRPNAANLGGNWSQPNNNIRLNNNTAQENNGATGVAYWNGTSGGGPTYGAKQGAAFTLANGTIVNGANGNSLILKATGGTATAPQNFVRVRLTASTIIIETTTNSGGAFANAGTLNNANSTFANGDVLTAQVDATGLARVWRTRGATTVIVGSIQLPSNALWTTGGGRIGMFLINGARVDNFRGGTLP
jgi:uncharacterized repeat protein (TIGR01451 family)